MTDELETTLLFAELRQIGIADYTRRLVEAMSAEQPRLDEIARLKRMRGRLEKWNPVAQAPGRVRR
jgi:hypothetical protein